MMKFLPTMKLSFSLAIVDGGRQEQQYSQKEKSQRLDPSPIARFIESWRRNVAFGMSAARLHAFHDISGVKGLTTGLRSNVRETYDTEIPNPAPNGT
ncbi:hypothetical protein [Cupriavidus necator]|uniref:hypothetical protein n=1 Tax=Cupriavidus necator TaxID=106590 RepID=UPI0012D30992|nr:hypothetical protein [Cupriavidus necator]